MKEWKTEYKILSWDSLQLLEKQLIEMTNEPDFWQVDSHKLSGDDKGWTIYKRVLDVAPPMTSFEIKASVVWNAMSSTEMYQLAGDYDDPRRKILDLITNKIKEDYHKRFPNAD